MAIRTHYDNLQISHDADADEIRRAYRRLSKQYHPDRNQDPDAHRIMQLINQAYAVLSDPVQRAEHDFWISTQQQLNPSAADNDDNDDDDAEFEAVSPFAGNPPITAAAPAATPAAETDKKIQAIMLACTAALLGLLLWQLWYAWGRKSDETEPAVPSAEIPAAEAAEAASAAASPPTDASYIRPVTAPNGNPWPSVSGYIDGYPQIPSRGLNRLFVENIRNSSDVFVELFAANQTQALRTFFIEERSQMTLDNLDAGEYTVRYLQLDSGETLTSEVIRLGGKQKEATLYLQRSKAPVGL